MRTGACAVQQTLTAEAASVLKHSLGLARRRGHAQVTPLHVAATLLGARASLLRRACLKSQPHQPSHHPLQCRALELCFNVALNRLPTSPSPLLHAAQPSLSNALVAALKRAQAHQRRGCIEQQQQQQQQQPPLLAIKVELEQLIISILDDPSVSRVMREAGFSSTSIKNNLEDSSVSSVFQCYNGSSASGGGVFSSPCSPSPGETHQRDFINSGGFWPTHFLNYSSEQNPVFFSPPKRHPPPAREDLRVVLEVLLRKKRRNTVIVGDSLFVVEGLVSELMERLGKRDVPEELKNTQFVKFQFSPVSLKFMKKDEVEGSLSELKRKVDALVSAGRGGAIVYLGDLKWAVEANSVEKDGGVLFNYSPVDHLVAEIGRLISDYSCSGSKVWLMATANYQTYSRCQMRQPPLENQWALQAVAVPSGGLGLSLHSSSINDSRIFPESAYPLETKPSISKDDQEKLMCCAECTSNYEKEVAFKSNQQKLLPSFLQLHSTEASQKDDLLELRRKWNRICQSLHSARPYGQNHLSASLYNNQSLTGKSFSSYAAAYPWLSTTQNSIFPDSHSISFVDPSLKSNHSYSAMPRFRRQQSCHIEFSFNNEKLKHETREPRLDSLKETPGKEVKITLALGNSLIANSEELVTERTLQQDDVCKSIQENVPWHSETIPSIVGSLINNRSTKKETWLMIHGNDSIGKRRLALAIAETVFGSADLLLHLDMSKRANEADPYPKTLAKALTSHKMLVVLVEHADRADAHFMKLLADSFEAGKSGESDQREGTPCQTIYILTTGGSSSHDDGKRFLSSVVPMKLQIGESTASLGSSSSDQKRKAEWDLAHKTKSPRLDEMNDYPSIEKGNSKKEFMRQLSSNNLDLNIRAEEEEESEDTPAEFSPISSDLTLETAGDPQSPKGFLELIENRFALDVDPAGSNAQLTEFFLSKLKGSFMEVLGVENVDSFGVEHMVLEEIVLGSGYFLSSLFEKWLKEVFQTSLKTVKIGGGGGIRVRLSFGDKEEGNMGDRFMGSSLPKQIQVLCMD